MFHREKVIAALEAKADHFTGYDVQLANALAIYESGLAELSTLSYEEITARLAGVPWPGARPTAEHDAHRDLIVPFGGGWASHEEARAWAREVLEDVPTIAVDGSQITPTTDLSVPVGAVQIGWFVNPHRPGSPYIKSIDVEVLAPDELGEDDSGGHAFPDWRVNLRRFAGECEHMMGWMAHFRDAARKPVCFFDGSLILSFVQQMRPERQRQYIKALKALLATSETLRVPLVGYIDSSQASDLLSMLIALTGRRGSRDLSDGALVRQRMAWGDRTTAWICARNDQVELSDAEKYYEDIVFVYLKTTAEGPPARLDLPRWILEDGQLDAVVDIVRAECVVGNGYPYAVETADAVAVITQQDRERFYRVLQEFAQQRALPLRFRTKSMSKRGRR
ncbi:MAG: DNA double-strand break repair nuclease NurA [Anaerolineae bacterium]|nr:DNA double-strand break repair nuclease NurA [Anaerolineae bacterium]